MVTFWRLSLIIMSLTRRVELALNGSDCVEVATFSNLHDGFTSCARTMTPAMSKRGAGPRVVGLLITATQLEVYVYVCNVEMSTPSFDLFKTLGRALPPAVYPWSSLVENIAFLGAVFVCGVRNMGGEGVETNGQKYGHLIMAGSSIHMDLS